MTGAARRSVLDEPGAVGARRVALHLADRVDKRWNRLVAATDASVALDASDDGAVLHAARVSLRTLRSWLDAHDDLIDVPRTARRRLRDCAHATNDWRDGEVLATRLDATTWPTAAASDAARAWSCDLRADQPGHREVIAVAKDVERALRDVRKRARVVRWKQRVDRPTPRPTPFATELAARLEHRAAILRARLAAVDGPAAAAEQHRARIAAKRARYLLEPVAGELPEADDATRLLKELQDVLGELHDLDVARHAADIRVPNDGGGGMTSVRAVLQAVADAAYRTLDERWLATSAAALFAAIDGAITALRARGTAGVEIERKLLLRGVPDLGGARVESVTTIEQGYLPGERITERVRRIAANGEVCHLRTVKTGTGMVRTETEEVIELALFESLWPLTAGRRVHKRRTVARDEHGRAWEIDEFLDRELVLAELELPSADADATPPPWLQPWVERDVTDEPDFTNARLAR